MISSHFEVGRLALVRESELHVALLLTYTYLGKTLLAKTLARVLDVPFSQSDATSFTQVSPRIAISRLFLTAMIGGLYVDHPLSANASHFT